MADQPHDDVDRLFARLEPVEPAPDLRWRIVARIEQLERRRLRLFALAGAVVELAALVLLAFLAFGLGYELSASGGADFLGVMLENSELVLEAPGETLGAFGEFVPWEHVAAVALLLVAVVVGTALLTTRLLGPRAVRAEGSAWS